MSEWWRGAVFYQIYPRSYYDTTGDGVGDLEGIRRKLDYVASLGVDGVWLSPFFRSPMKDFGYDVSDYRDVDPMFGTIADFEALVAKAHDLGLRIIVDQVYSHTSDRHPWFEESRQSRDNPKADWYVWADPKPDGSPPNNWLGSFGGVAWTWDSARRQYYLHNFLNSQPDLNFHNPEVRAEILDTAKFWLNLGVDGFRLDVVNYYFHDPALTDNPPRENHRGPAPYYYQVHVHDKSRPETPLFLEELRKLTDRYDGAMTVGEISDEDMVGRMAEYTGGSNRLHTAYSFVLLTRRFGPKIVREALETFFAAPNEPWPSWAFSNHDVPRAVSRWSADGKADAPPALAKQLVALLTCLRGTAFLYQGEELGLPQAEVPRHRLQDPEGIAMWPNNIGRDGARTPMPWQAEAPQAGFSTTEPWLPVDPRHFPLAVDRQEADPASPLAFTRRWLAWRKTHSALKDGEIRFMDVAEPLLAFERWNAEDHVLCLFNLSDTEVKLTPAHAKAAGAETLAAYGFTVIAGADRFTADAPGTDDPARAERR